MTVPIATSPGRWGFGPQLSLSYDSGSGNGPFGYGWTLSVPAITRKTDKGLPRYIDAGESDVFILSGSEDLVPVLKKDGAGDWVTDETGELEIDDNERGDYIVRRYRPRIEGLFARVERWTRKSDGDVHWRSISRDNILSCYGKDANSRIADPLLPQRIFSWLICETRDDKGNAIVFEYKVEDGSGVDLNRLHQRNRGARDDPRRTAGRYLKRILYGNRLCLLDTDGRRPQFMTAEQLRAAGWMFEAVFDYGEHDSEAPTPNDAGSWAYRTDPFSSYRSGFEVRTSRICQRVLMFHHFPGEPGVGTNCLVRSTDFEYSHEQEPARAQNPVYTFLRAVTQTGYRRQDGGYLKRSLPPVEFEYTQAMVQDKVQEIDAKSLENLPVGLDGALYQWTDLHGEGVSGILTEQADAWFYKRNLSPISARPVEFGPSELIARKPNLGLTGGKAQFMDLAGDGQPDLVVLDGPSAGLYEHDDEEGWQPFRPFTSRLNRDSRDPNLRFVDLDGDGHADVLITEDEAFVWHPSLAENGFGEALRVPQALDEEKGPRLCFEDGTQSIYLADLSGDGLTDLVRVRNDEVCYWPNLGYGRFGAKVTMDRGPHFDNPDQFDVKRIRLADIDGSGTTDIIYLHRDGVRLYFNQSGNGWSAPQPLRVLPRVDDLVTFTPIDLLGNGTACLVWSSPLSTDAGRQMRYVDLMGGQKPHLLVKTVNNFGAETSLQYAPSTKFSLQDQRDGKPWVTRLPFPVHVVERVDTHDRISRNRFVTRYAYHHGYFDSNEREFRGFGMVEQWDTEEFAALDARGQVPGGTNVEGWSHVPPVLTKTWFHTGVYLGRGHVSDFFAGLLDGNDIGEYYREPGVPDAQARALLLDDTILPEGLTVDEEREACRALKGSMLRQEVYALDGTAKEHHPYTVIEQNFTIRALQPRGSYRHAVFLTHARESISYQYEREPADPRIGHALKLEVDDFGTVLQSVAIGYGRRQPDSDLSPWDRAKQAQTLITYTANVVTNAIEDLDDYRTPLPCESRSYELTGLAVPAGRNRFTFDHVLYAGTTATAIDYEVDPTAGSVQKRLIEHARTYYRRNDLVGPLPLGGLQSRALSFESYKLAFTPGLVAAVYGGRVGEVMLETEGHYVHSERDANFWNPSGRIFHSPGTSDTPSQELAYARQHFFLPCRYRDPFHTNAVRTETFVIYDAYDLLVQETIGALGDRVTVGDRNVDPSQPPVRLRHDYRVLQPAGVMDPNRNRSEVAFDALGMVVGTAVKGKPEENPTPGDRLAATFHADLTQAEIDQFLANPKGPMAATLLDEATTRVVYDVTAYWREPDPSKKPPVVAATLARETHASEPPPPGGLRIQASVSYSDGFGREIQKKIQAEPGPVPKRDASGSIMTRATGRPELTGNDVSPRWVGSGWTVFNNKGKPVRQYEPFFTDTHRFEFDVRIGVSPVLFYDPVERVVATLYPNHAWEKSSFDAWRQETWDVSDTVMVADPKADVDVGNFFSRLPNAAYVPTWHALRTDPAHGAEAVQRWSDPKTRDAEKRAAEKASVHSGTPTIAHTDSLGRPFLTVVHNRFRYSEDPAAVPLVEEFHRTRIRLDIEGNQREVIDPKDRIAMRYDYDMLGNRVHQTSLEAGGRWLLNDVAGKPIYAWDSRNHRRRTAYDPLRRPTHSFLREGLGAEWVVGRSIYGETRANPEARNLRGKVVQLFDQAGIVTSDDYDFKGNLLGSHRQLAQGYTATLDWSVSVPLDVQIYRSRTRYDALNRPTQLIAPHCDRPGTKVNVIQPIYNEANLLEELDAWFDQDGEPAGWLEPATASLHAVTDIDYDAKGQRTHIDHATRDGKLISTSYVYDPESYRLTQLYTRRGVDRVTRKAVAFSEDCETPPSPPATNAAPQDLPPGRSCGVQNVHYTYDPAGNITSIRDDARQTVYFRNNRIEPSADYTYDAIYRLIEATGREHLGQGAVSKIPHTSNDVPRVRLPHPGDGNAMGRYLERYIYDAVGNILSIRHRGTDQGRPGWRRCYQYAIESNRLLSTTDPSAAQDSDDVCPTDYSSTAMYAEKYEYDDHGNMLGMPHLQVMNWDSKDQLQMTQRQAVNAADAAGVGQPAERTWYVYDAAGQRVRKVTESAAGQIKDERIYLGGFEIHRRHGANPLVQETLHLMDGSQRIALVETRVQGSEPGVPEQLIRYQIGNHLSSASLEVDDQAQIISYEEYTPYGSTSYQGVRGQTETPKRYRYTGKERDEESGFYYHGARYYAPWLGRWVSCDVGVFRVSNVDAAAFQPYAYVENKPVVANDPDGEAINFVAAAVGAAVGAVVGGAIEAGRQYVTTGRVSDWGAVGASAAGGAVSGAVAGLTMGASLVVQATAAAASGVAGGATTRALTGQEQTAGAVLQDAAIGLVTFGIVRGGSAAISALRGGGTAAATSGVRAATGSGTRAATGSGSEAATRSAVRTTGGTSARGATASGTGTTASSTTRAAAGDAIEGARPAAPAAPGTRAGTSSGSRAAATEAAEAARPPAPSEAVQRIDLIQRMQQIVNESAQVADDAIARGDARVLGEFLTPREVTRLLAGGGLAAARRGVFIEWRSRLAFALDPLIQPNVGRGGYLGLRHVVGRGPRRAFADFFGTDNGLLSGMAVDITTHAGRAAHLARGYLEKALVLTY